MAGGKSREFDDFIITPENQFSVANATVQRKDERIQIAKKLLVVVMSRARNTGMVIEETNRSFIASPVFR